MSEERAPITFHLEELRRRIIVCLVSWLVERIISYIYAEDIIAVISAPAGKLYFLNPAEVFFLYRDRRLCRFHRDPAHPLLRVLALPAACPAWRGSDDGLVVHSVGTAPVLWRFGLCLFFVLPAAVSSSWALPRLPCSPCSPWRRTCLSSSPSCCPSPWALNCP